MNKIIKIKTDSAYGITEAESKELKKTNSLTCDTAKAVESSDRSKIGVRDGEAVFYNNQHTIFMNAVLSRERDIVRCMKNDYTVSFCKTDTVLGDTDIKDESEKLPIICILNGAGRNGKDTFAEKVGKYCRSLDITTISESMEVIEHIVTNYCTLDSQQEARKHIESKDDKYRTFLHDIKLAWSKFDNGPNAHIISKVERDTLVALEHNIKQYDIIFVNNRDKDEIINMKTLFNNLDYCVISLMVVGKINPASYNNGCDENVEQYDHDLYVYNLGTEEDLDVIARVFAHKIVMMNSRFGTRISAYLAHKDNKYLNDMSKNLSDVNDEQAKQLSNSVIDKIPSSLELKQNSADGYSLRKSCTDYIKSEVK